MTHRKRHMKVLSLIVCATLLAQTLWPNLALALDWSYYNPQTNDAIRNGVSLSYGRTTGPGNGLVQVTLPDTSKTRTDVHNFAVVPGHNPMWGRPVVTRLDTAAIENIITADRDGYIDSLINWKDPYTYSYITYDFDSLIANPLDTVVFSHVIVDTSLLDSTTMLSGDSARIAGITDRIRLQVANTVDHNDAATDDNALAWLYWDRNRDKALDAGDTPIDSSTWFSLAPGESLYVLVAAEIPVVFADSSMDTVSLICQTERTSPTGRRLTKIYKDIITIELVQALDAMAWIVPDTVIAGYESYIEYNIQLILGNADEFRFVNPFAYFTDTTGRNYDSMWVSQVVFGRTTTFNLINDTTRPSVGQIGDAAWYYDENTDTLYVKFAASRINEQDTLRITFGQYVPTKVKYDLVSHTYNDTQYLALFDDFIDPTEPDTADTILGIPDIWVIPDSVRVCSLGTPIYMANLHERIDIEVVLQDKWGNPNFLYSAPDRIITLEARNIHTDSLSRVVQYVINGDSSRAYLSPADPFAFGRDTIAARSDWTDTVVIWFKDTVENIIYGATDTLYWIDSIAPLIYYAATQDTNGNGLIDRIIIRFDSPVENVTKDGFRIGSIDAPESCIIINDTLIYLSLFERSSWNTGVTPYITYNSTWGNITDRSQLHNPMRDTGFTALDSAGPVLFSAWYHDNKTQAIDDDRLELLFSEPIDDNSMGVNGENEFALYYNGQIPGGFRFTTTFTGSIRDDDTAWVQYASSSYPCSVMHDSMNMLACVITDLQGNCDPGNNQKVRIKDRTPPEVYWISPVDSVLSSQVTRLEVNVRVVEWQSIGYDSVVVEWRVGSKTSDSAYARMVLNWHDMPPGHDLTKGDSLLYRAILDLTHPDYLWPGYTLAGDDEIIFSIIATDDAGNVTRIDSIAIVRINATSRWYHCSRGDQDGYQYGVGYHRDQTDSLIGPYDAWCYVPRNTIIFDSVAIEHFYNGEIQDNALEDRIEAANINAMANEYIRILDSTSNVKVHELSLVDKYGNHRRYDRDADRKLVIEIYYDDLNVQNPEKLTLFKFDDYAVVELLDLSLDTLRGSQQWVPILTDEARVVPESMKVVFEVNLDYVDESDEGRNNALLYGLGVFTIMEYTPPKGLISSVVNYPNPFNAGDRSTRISYVLIEDADVTITICNMIGDLVWKTTFEKGMPGGMGNAVGFLNVVEWNGRNGNGRVVANGGYICKIRAEASGQTKEIKRKIGVLK